MKKLKACVTAMRLRTLPLSLAGVSLGLMLAASDYVLRPWVAFFTLATTVFLQILSNVSNELGDFLNMPVKYYSSGMFVRLAFSTSTAFMPDILLLDEVFAAGDAGFIEKATRRMKEMVNVAKILVMVTHNMETALDICNRCIWMDRGRLRMDGTPEEVVKAYLDFVK